jgi:hypothetical protein
MFRPEDIKKYLRKQPFEALRFRITAGDEYVVRHPDLVMVGNRSIFIGLPKPSRPMDSVFDRTVEVALIHLAEIEPLPPPPGRKARANGKKG